MVFDTEAKSVLHTEMAKKNLFVKRGELLLLFFLLSLFSLMMTVQENLSLRETNRGCYKVEILIMFIYYTLMWYCKVRVVCVTWWILLQDCYKVCFLTMLRHYVHLTVQNQTCSNVMVGTASSALSIHGCCATFSTFLCVVFRNITELWDHDMCRF